MRIALLLLAFAACSDARPLAPFDPGQCFYCGPSCRGNLYPCTLEQAAEAPCAAYQDCGHASIYGPDDPNDPGKRDR